MPRLRRAAPDAVTLAPMGAGPQIDHCRTCGSTMLGTGRFSTLVDGRPPCNVCRAQLLGTEADRFVSVDLELLAARVASLPRGAQRRTAARLLLAAARQLVAEHGGPTAEQDDKASNIDIEACSPGIRASASDSENRP